ncbi:DUF5719 family protein [Trueperella pyogenes]|uniref:DUF5719 family protein n=1 Tax=Trueperella pyogenes TaxID=1661 RepID=UPI00043ABBAF|nr:DUF5719 family protein [Trueperella pyogenes]AHU90479.1 hypothetical protein CQ11_05005 [Trueperella pyogenes]OQD37842.1 hypothetical protein B1R42_05475 [Trueperella pyogenes]UVJ57323.1 DUF5719 family protein [Trueperella pyogenes]
MKKVLGAIGTGMIVLALAGGAALGTRVPVPEPTFIPAPQGKAVAKSADLVCYSHPLPTAHTGINATDVDEAKTSWAGAFAAGEATFNNEHFTGALAQKLITKASGVASISGVVRSEDIAAGTSIQQALAGDSRGLVAAPCEWPGNTVWLVGGAAKVGSTSTLMIRNTSPTTTTIDIAVYSSRGRLDIQGLSKLPLEAGAELTRDLTGLIPDDPRIALRLSSDTGSFVASMQVSQLNGVTPAGIEILTDSATGVETVIPGVVIDERTDSSIRIVNPHEQPATVSVSTLADAERPLPGAQGVTVAPQSVLDLSLSGLVGTYGIKVKASHDVASAVSLTRTDDNGSDIAWLSARDQITRSGLAVGPYPGTLVLHGDGQARWTSYGEDGTKIAGDTLAVAGTAKIDIPQQAHYITVEANQPMYGAAMLAGESGITWLPLTQDATAHQATKLTIAN